MALPFTDTKAEAIPPSIASLNALLVSFIAATFMSMPRRAPMMLALKDGDAAAAARVLGVFASLGGALELVCNPVIASLSERHGRKPFLAAVPLLGAALHGVVALRPGSMAAHAACHSVMPALFTVFITQAFACLGDVLSGHELAMAMARFSTFFGLGTTLGPMAGARLNGVQSLWASALCLAAASIWATAVVPETKAIAKRKEFSLTASHPLKFIAFFRDRSTSRLAATVALQSCGNDQNVADLHMMFSQLALGYNQAQQSRLMTSMGFSRLFGGMAGATLIQRLGPERFTLLANAATASSMCLLGAARGNRQLAASIIVLSLGHQRHTAATARLHAAGKQLGMGPGEVTAANMNLLGLVRILTATTYSNIFAWGTSGGRTVPGLPYFLIAVFTTVAQFTYKVAN